MKNQFVLGLVLFFTIFLSLIPTEGKTPSASKKQTKGSKSNNAVVAYIDRYKATAIQEHKRFCIPASITLAQGILESASGQSILVKKTNNHFGIKCVGHCNNKNSVMMADDDPYDRFLKYKSAWFSYRHHSRFLTDNTRYEKCFECGDNYKCWARQLKKAGYATSKTYAEKLIKIIETYKLYKYDRH
jgi:flagellum-specific peptidoglycan hydrolase FlgJ